MYKIKFFFLGTVFSLFIQNVNAEDSTNSQKSEEPQYVNDGVVEYYCNSKKSYFAFYADSPEPQKDAKKLKIETYPLLITSKEDSFGNYMRLGSKKAIRQCGTIKVIFESGYYNANIQGELGLMDYPLMSISINGKKILDKSILNLCASGGVREVCPSDSAIQSIEITKKTSKLYKMALTTAIPQDKNESFRLEKKKFQLKVK